MHSLPSTHTLNLHYRESLHYLSLNHKHSISILHLVIIDESKRGRTPRIEQEKGEERASRELYFCSVRGSQARERARGSRVSYWSSPSSPVPIETPQLQPSATRTNTSNRERAERRETSAFCRLSELSVSYNNTLYLGIIEVRKPARERELPFHFSPSTSRDQFSHNHYSCNHWIQTNHPRVRELPRGKIAAAVRVSFSSISFRL